MSGTTRLPLSRDRLKTGYYALTALGTLASSYYFNYLFFFMRDRFHFGDRENLAVAALHGSIYIVSAWQCGRFAQRYGFHTSLKIGFAGVTLCMIAGALVTTAVGQMFVLAAYTVALLFIWPALEALTTDNEPPARVPRMIGIYNCTWSGAAAIAYFTGGTLYGWLGRGALFWMPAAIFGVEWFMTVWLEREARRLDAGGQPPVAYAPRSHDTRSPSRVPPATFLTLAWLANPLSYVAVYTLFAIMPGLARTLGLSPARVGLFCSVWLFGRLVAFVVLWNWTGWQYRFRWLSGSYVLLAGSFVAIVLAPSLWMLALAQAIFGLAAGLMYYSSLFYSMDLSDTKAEHGGLHEAALGVGICAGPAVGALSLQIYPELPQAGAVAVTAILAAGFVALVAIWGAARGRNPRLAR